MSMRLDGPLEVISKQKYSLKYFMFEVGPDIHDYLMIECKFRHFAES